MATADFHAVGRRKSAVARVRLVPGEGRIVINKRDIDQYFGLETLKMTERQPMTLRNVSGFDVLGTARSVTASAALCARLTPNCVPPSRRPAS